MRRKDFFLKKSNLIFLIAIISFFILLGGSLFYSNEKTELLIEKKSELKAIAELKRVQISRWLNERYADVSVISSSSFFAEAIEDWISHPNNDFLRKEITNRLSTPQIVFGYDAISLTTLSDKILLLSGDSTETINKKVTFIPHDFKNSNDIKYSDFYYCEEEREIHFDIIAPIFNRSKQAIAKIVFRIDPNKFLYPFIQSWPTNSYSSETILVKKENDSVLFLNELRHKKNTALKLKLPLSNQNLPASKAVNGFKGFFEGIDYRSKEVISYLDFIPETRWFMVTKVDKEELLRPLYFKSFVIIMISTLSILIIALSIITIYSRKQRNIFRSLYSTQQEFKTTLYSIGDAVITTDNLGRILHLNKVAENLTGWTESEAQGLDLESVFKIINEDTREIVENPVTKVLSEGISVNLANHTILISKNGTETPIADSGAPIKTNEDEIVGVVLVFRDQSEERRTQKLINSRLKLIDYANNLSFDELLTKSIDVVCDMTNSPIGFYHFVNEDETELTLQAWSTQAQQTFCQIEGKNMHYPINKAGVLSDCVKERKAVIHNDDESLVNKSELHQGHALVKRKLVFPILRNNKIVSIIGIGNKPRDYNERDVETVEYLADIIWEIVEQKRSHIVLIESEEKFRLFYENSPVAYQSLDINGNLLEVNNSWLSLLGYNNEEVIGKNISEFLTKESAEKLPENFKILLEKGSIQNIECSMLSKHKKIFEISITATVENNSDGNFVKAHCVLHNITSLKKHEEELEKAAAEWKITFDSTTDGILLLNNELRVLKINKSMSKLCQKTTEEIIGHLIEDSLINSKINPPEYLFNSVRNSKKRESEIQKSGDMWFEYIIEPILSLDKEVNGFVFIVRNVTDQKTSEFIRNLQYQVANAALKATSVNELFELIRVSLSEFLDVTNFFMAFYDEETKMLKSNIDKDEKDQIPEWPAEKSLTGIVIKNNKPLLASRQMIENMVENGIIDLIGTIPEVWIGYPIRVKDKILGAVVIQSYDNPYAYDISSIEVFEIIVKELSFFLERKIAEENALKLSKSIEQTPVSIIITDVNGKIEYVNPKFTEVSGYSFREVFGQNPNLLRSGYQSKEFYENLWETILSGKDWHGEVLNKKKSGDDFWESVIISPIMNEHKQITHFVAVKEDITEKKKILEDLVQAKEKAEEMNKVKSVFFANMSHELRTPFVGILGYAHLLLDTITDPEAKEMVEGIIRASNRLTNTLSMILDLTKLEFEKTEVKIIEANVIDIIDEVYKQFSKAALQKNIELRKKYNFDNLSVQTDPNLLIHVLINLVNNAVKFTDKGFIEVEADYSPTKNNKTVFIKVIDSGLGIPAEKQQLIWEEFRQVSEGTTRGYQGTGLGLSIAKKYIELLGGKISLVSKVGVGSSFIIELPLKQKIKIAKPLTPVVLDQEIPKPSEQKNSKKILYIEDDFSSRDVIRRFLSNEYVIELADGPDSALHFIRENKYDCILMDINLGTEINGVKLSQIIKKIPGYANTPIIAVTAFASYDDKKAFLEQGLNYYIAKPFMKQELLELINNVFAEN